MSKGVAQPKHLRELCTVSQPPAAVGDPDVEGVNPSLAKLSVRPTCHG